MRKSKRGAYERITLRLPEDLAEHMKRLARQRGRTLNNELIRSVRVYVRGAPLWGTTQRIKEDEMNPTQWKTIEAAYASILADAREGLTILLPPENIKPFLAALVLVAAAAKALPDLAGQEAPAGVVADMRRFRGAILDLVGQISGPDEDGVPDAFRQAFEND